MKINKLLGLVRELMPTPFSDDVLLMWLSNCENSILTEVCLLSPEECTEIAYAGDAELLVPHPYDKLYLPYMQAQICHANGETDKYMNFMALYNTYRDEFAREITQNVNPGNGGAVRMGYYLSAYNIAKLHGFEGSEAEWLESLHGEPGPQGPQGVRGQKGETGERGESGATFTPLLDEDGMLSWSNDAGLINPLPINIRGPAGLGFEDKSSGFQQQTEYTEAFPYLRALGAGSWEVKKSTELYRVMAVDGGGTMYRAELLLPDDGLPSCRIYAGEKCIFSFDGGDLPELDGKRLLNETVVPIPTQENAGQCLNVDSTGKAAWTSTTVNAKLFGAVGDGVTDDTDALRRARDAAVRLKKALYIPAGTYMLHGSIELWSNCEIFGDGNYTVLKKIAAVSELIKPRGTSGAFSVGQTVFTVNDGSKYTVGHDCYVGVRWQNGEGLCGHIVDITGNDITVQRHPKKLDSNEQLLLGLDGSSYGESYMMNLATTSVVLSQSFPVFCSHKYTQEGALNPLHDVYIHDLAIDGNRQEVEANIYYVSAVHFDPLGVASQSSTEAIANAQHENIRLENLNIINSPSDGISVQSGKNVCVTNCITAYCGYNGVHFGVCTSVGSVIGCKLNADFCGYFDCVGVSAVSISNNHFERCLNGIGGIDRLTRGLTITGNTFRNCEIGVQAGATKNPQNMIAEFPSSVYMGKAETGITISGNAFYGKELRGTGIAFAKGAQVIVTDNAFRDLETAMDLREAKSIHISGNVIKDCAKPLTMGDDANEETVNSAFTGNVIAADANGSSAALSIKNAKDMLVTGNIISGYGAALTVDAQTASGVIQENNIVSVEEVAT